MTSRRDNSFWLMGRMSLTFSGPFRAEGAAFSSTKRGHLYLGDRGHYYLGLTGIIQYATAGGSSGINIFDSPAARYVRLILHARRKSRTRRTLLTISEEVTRLGRVKKIIAQIRVQQPTAPPLDFDCNSSYNQTSVTIYDKPKGQTGVDTPRPSATAE